MDVHYIKKAIRFAFISPLIVFFETEINGNLILGGVSVEYCTHRVAEQIFFLTLELLFVSNHYLG